MSVFAKRHYEKLAEMIAAIPYTDHYLAALNTFCACLKQENPNFKEDKFRKVVADARR